MNDKPSQSEVDAVLSKMEQAKPVASIRRLPPLQSMSWSEDEKRRLRTYSTQMTRYRLRRWWRRLLFR